MDREIIRADEVELKGHQRQLGPAMAALTERQRDFVRVLLETGTGNMSKAARLAGYQGDSNTIGATAHRLAHDPRVQAAIQEEAGRRLNTGAIMAVSRLVEITENTMDQKVALKGIEMILNRTGLHATSEHKVAVTHSTDDASQIARIKALALQLGMDPTKVLGTVGVHLEPEPLRDVVDAEFTEVVEATSAEADMTDLEDFL